MLVKGGKGDYHSWFFCTYAVGGHADDNLKQIMCTFHHCALCHEVSVMVSQYRVRWWHGTVLATSHYLFHWWPWFMYMCTTWTQCVNDVLRNHILCSNRFSKRRNITPSGPCLRHIGSSAADVLVKFQSDRTTLNTNFAASRLTIRRLIRYCNRTQYMINENIHTLLIFCCFMLWFDKSILPIHLSTTSRTLE